MNRHIMGFYLFFFVARRTLRRTQRGEGPILCIYIYYIYIIIITRNKGPLVNVYDYDEYIILYVYMCEYVCICIYIIYI